LRLRVAVALLLGLSAAACSPNEVTIGPEEPVETAHVDAAVSNAAQELLERESIPIAVLYFDAENPEEVVRYDWIDYRPGGDVLAVYRYLDRDQTIALSLVDGVWMTALDSERDDSAWEVDTTLTQPEDVVPAIGVLNGMSEQATLTAIPTEAIRQTASDGSELWTLNIGDDAVVSEWIVSPGGLLQFYRVFDSAGHGDGVSTITHEYGIGDDEPGPVVAPIEGNPLQLDDLAIPTALRGLETAEE